jgi:hypothetical protein
LRRNFQGGGCRRSRAGVCGGTRGAAAATSGWLAAAACSAAGDTQTRITPGCTCRCTALAQTTAPTRWPGRSAITETCTAAGQRRPAVTETCTAAGQRRPAVTDPSTIPCAAVPETGTRGTQSRTAAANPCQTASNSTQDWADADCSR